MEPALAGRSAIWLGASGSASASPPSSLGACRLVDVRLDPDDVTDYYEGFCNAAVWPLYHDAVATPAYHRHHMEAYERVNGQFADAVTRIAPRGATVWVQDYHLQLVPLMLRRRRPDLRIGFFLHIPFPPPELFAQIPWRRRLLEGLLGADLLGFQTPDGVRNLLESADRLLGLRAGDDGRIGEGTRRTAIGCFPVGIDAVAFSRLAADAAVRRRAAEIRIELGSPRSVLLGIDRLDYTKGIDIRIRACAEVMATTDVHSLSETGVALVQVAVPSRENVHGYQRIRDEIEMLVGRANGDLSRLGYPAIHYLHQHLDREELVALYLAADVMLVTPLRDGMNLVAKEYVACRNDGSGMLVLSEFAGAANQLRDALLVNPYDGEAVQAAIGQALHAPAAEQQRRMSRLRRSVFDDDVSHWAGAFLGALEGARSGVAA